MRCDRLGKAPGIACLSAQVLFTVRDVGIAQRFDSRNGPDIVPFNSYLVTYLLTHSHAPCSPVRLEKLTGL